MDKKNLRARLLAGALALTLAFGIGATPALAAEGPGMMGKGEDSLGTTTDNATDNGGWIPDEDDDHREDKEEASGGGGSVDSDKKRPTAPVHKPGGDAVPSTTAPATNTVTVNGAVPGATYDLYKLLQLEAKTEEYVPEGATDPAKRIVTYRYSYGDGLKDIIGAVVALPAFEYAETAADATHTHPGYGFKVDGENLVFITPVTADNAKADPDYEHDGTVQKMMTAFADELRKRIDDTSGLTPAQTKTAPAEGENLAVSFEKVPNGYWMVASNAGARSIIFTSPLEADISQDVAVNEKNPAPTVEKQVLDYDDAGGTAGTGGGSWQDSNDAQIGDEVVFKITVKLHKGAENIIVYDAMDDGLTFKQINGVKFYPRSGADAYDREVYKAAADGGKGPAGGETTKVLELTGKDSVYELAQSADKRRFALVFKNSFTNPAAGADNRDEDDAKNNVFLGDLSTLEDDGGKIEIEYTAVLNENAVIGGDGNVNDAYAKYGHIAGVEPGEDPPVDPDDPDDPVPENPPHDTPHDETTTYTYEFSLDKFVSGDSGTKLAGAEFEIRQSFVSIGTEAVDGKGNAWIGTDGKLKVPAAEYDISGEEALSLVDITAEVKAGDATAVGVFYRVAVAGDTGTTTKIVTDATGRITVRGLDSNLYSITETKAPKGYNKLDVPVMMAVGSAFSANGGKVFTEDASAARADGADYAFTALADTTVGIANASGVRMPDTGGIGTTVFYVGGGLMLAVAAGAGAVVMKKRRDEDAE